MSRNHATGKVPPADQPTADPGDQSARSSSAPRSAAPYPDGGDRARTGRSAARRCAPGTRTAAPRPAGVCHRYQRSLLSSRLFGTGWDDPQMAGYACWYNLQQIFSWLAAMGWQVILHTGVTTRSDLLQRFLQLAANHFPPATLNSWRFVWHWSPQASEAARQAAWRQQRGFFIAPAAAAAAGDLAPLCSQRSRERSAVPLAAAGRGGFSRLPGRCQRTAGSGPGRQQPPGLQRTLPAAQAAADPQRPAPASAQPAAVAALLEYADRRYAGYQRPLFAARC